MEEVTPDQTIRHVVIVGGGTAGWLTAGVLAADHRAHAPDGLRVTVVESPDAPILGVGEGTWPSLRDTLRRIGLDEGEFLRTCQASFKQGSRFDGWVTGGPDDSYLHPFDAPPSQDDVDALSLWRAAPEGTAFADAVSAQAHVCAAGRAPKQTQTPPFAAVTNYAYHLDAPALAQLLTDHCTTHLGVGHIRGHVAAVEQDDTGDVAALRLATGEVVEGDMFVDCTGGKALLIGETLGAALTDVSDVLFNDRALAVHVPHGKGDPIASQTNATAMPAGWVWDIALQTRRGVGHVFSSAHMDEAAARDALTGYLRQTAPGSGLTGDDARLIAFRSAYRQTPWVKNVVAIGMAQGFVEPLEASAIVMIELAAAMVSDTLPANRNGLAAAARRFNTRFAYRWGRIVDFLKVHYVLSRRREPYWQAHRDKASWPQRLVELVDIWRSAPPCRDDFPDAREIFPAASYAFVLYGMGFETTGPGHVRRTDAPARARQRYADITARAQRLVAGLPVHRDLLIPRSAPAGQTDHPQHRVRSFS